MINVLNVRKVSFSLKISRNGSFVGCQNYPECKYIQTLTTGEEIEQPPEDEGLLGEDNKGRKIFFKTGKFGPYVQLLPNEQKGKPKNVSVPKDQVDSINLDRAIQLLSLPKELGKDNDNNIISATIGKYGPYISTDKRTAKLDNQEQVFEITLKEAIELLTTKGKDRKHHTKRRKK